MWTAESGQALKRVQCVARGRQRQCQSQRYHFSDRRGRCKSCATSSDSTTKNLYKCTRISLTRAALASVCWLHSGWRCVPTEAGRGEGGQLAHTHTHMPAHRGKYAQIMAQLNRHFWATNVTVRGATRRDTGRVEAVRRGKCARRGWRTTYAYVGVRALFAAAAARCKWHVVNFAAGRRTQDGGQRTADSGRWTLNLWF